MARIHLWIPLLSKSKYLDPETLVLRKPAGMTAATAIVSQAWEGHALVYWAGCQAQTRHGGLILGSGVIGCYLSIGAAEALGDEAVLVREGEFWTVAIIQRGGALCECGARALQDRGGRKGPCRIHPECRHAVGNYEAPRELLQVQGERDAAREAGAAEAL